MKNSKENHYHDTFQNMAVVSVVSIRSNQSNHKFNEVAH